jgi:hypothetical protein
MEINIYEQITRKSKEFNSHILSNPKFLEHIITKKMNIDDFDLMKKLLSTVEEIEEDNKLSNLEEFQ